MLGKSMLWAFFSFFIISSFAALLLPPSLRNDLYLHLDKKFGEVFEDWL